MWNWRWRRTVNRGEKIPSLTGVLKRVDSLSNTQHNPVLKSLDIEDVELDLRGLELDGK